MTEHILLQGNTSDRIVRLEMRVEQLRKVVDALSKSLSDIGHLVESIAIQLSQEGKDDLQEVQAGQTETKS
jgi:uncharacterized coiled-coil protein SlyX